MGGGGRDAAWNSTVALFAIAIASGCGLRRPSMATGSAGLRVDWCGCLCRLHRHFYLAGVSLHFAPWDRRDVLAQPD